ncbi:tRNA 2-thiouridine synthesizing protein C [Sinobacterium caligoides]|uniref:tRNA 2-thiouridine synthesizing protein C n=1 Tax=Sinobacterium caligoides TaxID=933926 RepID=A0A3N2DL47_9GAMM|nr:sulfurtransferase complex subunit TusC [Sinobacterium caligoides]ROS00075.1 tRNA 2-thiouridine synthesizing protein C [Sinobacterium caligoides]
MTKTLLFILRHSPYQTNLSKEAIDAALAGAVFEQRIQLLFTGEGVWQAVGNQQSEAIASKSIEANLQALSLYDIEDIYIDQDSLSQRGIPPQQIALSAKCIDTELAKRLIKDCDQILSF